MADEPQPGNVKVTREDWLNVAMDLLISDGVSDVKVLTIGERLGVSRSSFYWYFKSRQDLLDRLLERWQLTNTAVLIEHAERPAGTITEAVLNLFRCFVDHGGFNHRLDFAVREWARRDGTVRRVIDRVDSARHAAIARMFERFGYPAREADIRARVLYFQQIGYYALDLAEPAEERLKWVDGYVHAFTGIAPPDEEVARFRSHILERMKTGLV